METRYSPERSARLHQGRHGWYRSTQSERRDIAEWSDADIVMKLDRLLSQSDVWLSRRTGSRVRKRLLIQEAERRGL